VKHIKLQDIVEANQLLMSMGGVDQLPVIASSAIERSLELQSRVDRAIRYAEEAHSSSLHVKQVLRILDGSITLDDENNEVYPEPVVHRQPLDDYPRLVRRPLTEAPPAPAPDRGHHSTTSPLAGRSTDERKAFRTWLDENDMAIPYNQPVPPELVARFDEATGGRYKPKPRQQYRKSKTQRGKLKPGHGLDGRSPDERLHMRNWLKEQGFDINPSGRIPQSLINHYDEAMKEIARMQREARQKRDQPHEQQEQEQHAQGA
jgi:hypothetical protein